MMTAAVFFAAWVVLLVCVVLMLHPHYEDGLLGRLALAVIALAAYGRAGVIWERGFDIYLSWVAIALWCGLALFLGRHLYRFINWRRCGSNEWREGSREGTTGKRS